MGYVVEWFVCVIGCDLIGGDVGDVGDVFDWMFCCVMYGGGFVLKWF